MFSNDLLKARMNNEFVYMARKFLKKIENTYALFMIILSYILSLLVLKKYICSDQSRAKGF